MKVTLYKRPDGHTQEIEMKNVYPEDAAYFEANNVRISMEETDEDFIVYADDGVCFKDEPDELIEFAKGRTCQEVLKCIREQSEARCSV